MRNYLLVGLLAAAVLVLYGPVSSFEFVYDDDLYVARNNHVLRGLTSDGVRWAFTTYHAGNWHPLTWLSHMADVDLHGVHAGGHHITNVLIHLASTVLLFFVISAMTGATWTSALVAALFAVHPLHVESVAWVSERKDVLGGLFWILTMGAYVLYVRRPSLHRYVLVLVSFGLGLLSKPMVVTLPFVLLLLDYWPLNRLSGTATGFERRVPHGSVPVRSNALRLVGEKIPLILLAVPICIVAVAAQRSAGALLTLEKIPIGERVANALVSYAAYLGKAVWPVHLAVYYPHLGMPPAWQIASAAILLAALSGVAAMKAREMPFLGVGWLWYLGTLVPVIGLVQVGSQAMADRYTYIPLMGIYLAAAWGAKSLVERHPGLRRPAAASVSLLLAGLLFLTSNQVMTWRTGVSLFEHAAAVTGVNPVAHNNAGAAYLDRNDCGKAVPHFLKAIEQKRDYASAYCNLGICAGRENRVEEAMRHFAQAMALEPGSAKPRIERGLLQAGQKNFDQAREDFLEALRIDPSLDGAHTNLGMIYLQQGNLRDAERHLIEALRLNPRSAEGLNNLAFLRNAQGRSGEAIDCLRKALALAPGHPQIERNLQILTSAAQRP
ncbi:MAG: tetratricopeptide repeat protein [Syntrophaceae bacterium]|nr:tetratricopeptide repeat protein [Syntrophaceae bacterium]